MVSIGEDVVQLERWEYKIQITWYHYSKNSLAASHKVKHTPQYDLPILILDIYPREVKTCIHTKACS